MNIIPIKKAPSLVILEELMENPPETLICIALHKGFWQTYYTEVEHTTEILGLLTRLQYEIMEGTT